jgi:leader peptidase (prepilin peptidase)/N-methyltransferase
MIYPILAFLFGLLIGSFLNVCIYRWPRDLSVVRPRSHCPACEKTIAWYDNIPLASFALLGGRCRSCRARIPLRYPVVEAATAILFCYFVGTLGTTLAAAKMCVFAAALVALIFSDLEERILPDELTLGGALAGLAFSLAVPMRGDLVGWMLGLDGVAASLAGSALGAILPAACLWGAGWLYQKVRHREGLGLGDVKLVVMAGSFLGLYGALLTLLWGSIAGAVLGYAYIRATHKDAATYELPFGAFLGAAAVLVAIAAPSLMP